MDDSSYVKLSIHRRHDFECSVLLSLCSLPSPSSPSLPSPLLHRTIAIHYLGGDSDRGGGKKGRFLMRINDDPEPDRKKGGRGGGPAGVQGNYVSLLKNVADVYGLGKDDYVRVELMGGVGLSEIEGNGDNHDNGDFFARSDDGSALERCAEIDFLTVTVKDQFVSRSDMFQLKESLINSWLYEGVRLDRMGCRVAVKELRRGVDILKSGVITPRTVFTFRSR